MSAFPWSLALALGLGHLRLAPRDFWSMTLRELVAALGPGQDPMTRGDLVRLMAEFPDRGKHGGES